MLVRPIHVIAILALLAIVAVPAFSQTASISVNAASTGKSIGSMHYGIFYEEINHAGDAGLWAELIANRSFENSTATESWTKLTTGGAAGTLAADTNNQYNTYNKTELGVTVTAVGTGKCGVYNAGYYSALPITSGKSYNCVIYARRDSAFGGVLQVRLEDSSATASNTYSITSGNLATTWTKYSFTLTATRTLSAARLAITTQTTGTFYLTFVSLMPADAVDGFRPDLLQKLVDLKPSFVRFPGGCYVEGDVLANAWQWKGGIGPQEGRRTHWNLWGYWNTNGLGLYEYLILCEKLGAEPLLVVNAGMAHGDNVTGTALDPYKQDALDAIEFSNGDSSTTWGAQRAAMGHAAPFNLKYLEIGNENGGSVYNANYAAFYTAIKAAYPYMNLVTNAPVPSTMQILDEHYYTSPDWFASQNHHYDGYSRTGPKIYVGEYAVTQGAGQGNLAAGLGEAMFMMGMERNADIVTMCSYAPLFVNTSNRAWNPDLIGFNSTSSYGIPSYYVQKMLSNNRGDINLATTSSGPAKTIDMTSGGVGVATWATQSEYADVLVTNGATTLYQSNFSGGTTGWTVDGGTWSVISGNLQQTNAGATDCRDVYYAPTWTDYTLTLKARKISGSEGFLIMFRVKDHNNYYWWNIGGWGNARTTVERCTSGGKADACSSTSNTVTTNVWYYIKIVVTGAHIQCYLKPEGQTDYSLIHDFTDNPSYPGFDAMTTRENATGDILVKVVNRTSNTLTNTPITITNTGWPKAKATVTTLTSASDADENSIANPVKVSPAQTQLTRLSLPFNYTIQPYSLTILRLSVDTVNVTATAGAGGTISPTGAVTVNYGTNKTFNIAPDTGYAISQVTVDGVDQGAISSYTFSNVQADHAISATFSQITYSIAASAGANGSISPSGSVTVNHGADQAFTISPNAGYAIADVTVDSVSQGGITSYTFNNVTANHAISAAFAKPTGMNNKCVLTDPYVLGRTVVVWGKVRSINGTTSFTISDGYASDVTVIVNGVGLPIGFDTTKIALVTGLVIAGRSVQAQTIRVVP